MSCTGKGFKLNVVKYTGDYGKRTAGRDLVASPPEKMICGWEELEESYSS
jgi:hypothetical protein